MISPGYIGNKDKLIQRLRKAEGQIRGIQNMVDRERYCIDILDQVSATKRALDSIALELLRDHLNHCLHSAMKEGCDTDEKMEEVLEAIRRFK